MRPKGVTGRLSMIVLLTWLLSSGCGMFSRTADPTPIPAVPTAQPTSQPTVEVAMVPTNPPAITATPMYGPPFIPAPTLGPPYGTPATSITPTAPAPTAVIAATALVAPGVTTISPPPTEEEAEAVVQAYFAAIEADTSDAARDLTIGTATEQTDAAVEQISKEADAEGVTVDLRVPELETQPLPPGLEGTPVQTDYVVEAWVDSGIIGDVKAREGRGSTLYHTVRTNDGIKIARIEGGLLPPSE